MAGTVALIVAAGRGTRFGGECPKQYLPLAGRPLLGYSLAAFAGHPEVTAVRAVIHPDDRESYDEAARGLDLLEPVPGGASRQESARLGLESLEAQAPDKVLIHDGARPFVANALISRVVSILEQSPGALPALPVTDTLKRGVDGLVGDTVPREGLWRAQTPQGFRYRPILEAHRAVAASGAADYTDDAAIAEQAGLAVQLVEGAADNLKVTTPEDLEQAARQLAGRPEDLRTGFGFDVHRFGPGDRVKLCGVEVPHDASLLGHSDADVGLHALTDALLGALAAGDIGDHFPPSDPRWAGAESGQFLAHAGGLVAARGGRIVNCDVTLICERPKVGPHRVAMVARVAEILGLEPDRVSVKATTTEQLGFTGRREGIAAQATATIALPRES